MHRVRLPLIHTGLTLTTITCALCLALGDTSNLSAGDWPQILGPQRNGIAEKEQLVDTLPAGGPETIWEHPVGRGFAGPAVAGDRVIVFHRVDDDEVIECLQADTGRPVWKATHPTSYQASIVPDDGPRAVPLIADGRVYVYGAQGTLHCLDLKTGKTLWLRKTHSDYGAQEGYFGAGSSPIIEDGRVIVNVGGGRESAGIVAFNHRTGETAWKATDESASYSSPVAVTIGGVRHLLFITRLQFVSLDPKTGKVRFSLPFGRRGPTVNGATPVILGDRAFLTASYQIGAVSAKIGATDVETLWSSDNLLSSQYATPIAHKGMLFGLHGRQDAGPAALRCIDPVKQEVRWSQDGFGYATIIKADDKLLILTTEGELVLAAANIDRYRELGRARILPTTARALPALSEGRLFARDTKTLKCINLRP